MQEMQDTWVWFLHWEDPLEEEMVAHYSILVWAIPWTEEPGRLQFMWLQSQTQLSMHTHERAEILQGVWCSQKESREGSFILTYYNLHFIDKET